jgi:hypothetical protein
MGIWQDVRFGIRALLNGRWYTLAAVLALALGLAANTAVFTFVNAVLLRSLPFDNAHEIITISSRDAKGQQRGVSIADFEDFRTARSFETLSIVAGGGGYTMSDDGGPQADRYQGSRVSSNIFHMIRQKPVIGRDFTLDDERLAEPVVMVGYGIWQTRYARDPSVIGKKVTVSGVVSTIIGVMPPGMQFPPNSEVWLLFAHMAQELRDPRRDFRNFQVIGRLAPGVTVTQAQAELAGIAAGQAQQFPDTNKDWAPWVRSWDELVNGPQITLAFWSPMGAVAFVLLIACANVANLLLARAATRAARNRRPRVTRRHALATGAATARREPPVSRHQRCARTAAGDGEHPGIRGRAPRRSTVLLAVQPGSDRVSLPCADLPGNGRGVRPRAGPASLEDEHQ